MKTLTLGIILQWPNYFHNFVLYKLFEFWSLEVGCSYKGKVHILHVSSNMNSTTVSEELFSALQTDRVDKGRSKVRSSRKLAN